MLYKSAGLLPAILTQKRWLTAQALPPPGRGQQLPAEEGTNSWHWLQVELLAPKR